MTDDMDLGALLIKEVERRNKILDKAVFDVLNVEAVDFDLPNILTHLNASELAEDLMMWSPEFASSTWEIENNRAALVASCQRWLDAGTERS